MAESLAARRALPDTHSVRSGLRTMALVFLLTGCSGGHGFTAEILPTPFPGTVLTAHGGKCVHDGCWFTYRVRITNPTGRDANVQGCVLGRKPRLRLPIMTAAGLAIPAQASKRVRATWILPIDRAAAKDLVGHSVACTGLDWHGHPVP